jgi:nucleotide-binding universal stress UspA family protein
MACNVRWLSGTEEEVMTLENKAQRKNHSVIVVGVDFSEASADALREAVTLAASASQAELHVVHVITASSPSPSLGTAVLPELAYLDGVDNSNKVLEDWLAPLRGGHIRVASHIRVGSPDRAIAQVATDVGADLIVVGTTGKQGLTRLVLGSVAESLVRHAPCAVLAHRPRAVPVWELIEPPCTDCLAVRQVTARATLWCQRHSEHHVRAHTYRETPDSYAMGSQTFRS